MISNRRVTQCDEIIPVTEGVRSEVAKTYGAACCDESRSDIYGQTFREVGPGFLGLVRQAELRRQF